MPAIILLIFMVTFVYASETLHIKKGWQLIGVPTSLDVTKSFNNKSVEIVWGFDALNQSWSGYSNNAEKSAKITANYKQLTILEPFQGVWIFSKEDWQLNFSASNSFKTPKNRTITLQIGWNLVTIPQKIVVSDKFFGDALVWKYSQDYEWSVNDNTLDFPSIDAIKQSEGVWVKSDSNRNINIDERSSKLDRFKSKDAMLSYIRSMIKMNKYYDYYAPVLMQDTVLATPEDGSAGATNESTKASDATDTNLQESGVDEGDILKHINNTHIFSVDNTNHKIIVTSFKNIAKRVYNPLTKIDFSNKNIVTIYLQNSRLAVISTDSYESKDKAYIAQDYSDSFTLDIFDINDISNITKIATHKIDGNYQDSRVIDEELYLISTFRPTIKYEYPKLHVDTICSTLNLNRVNNTCSEEIAYVEPSEPTTISSNTDPDDTVKVKSSMHQRSCENSADEIQWIENNCYQYGYDANGAWKYDYQNPIIVSENLLPTITSKDIEPIDLLSYETFYAPIKLNQSANITLLSRFSLEDGEYQTNSSFLGNTHTYYASLTSLYLVSSEYPLFYDYTNFKDQQMIYKFALDKELSYQGSGSVEGRMLNQFSMSEKENYLRLATTSGWSWWSGGETTNSIYTLLNEDGNLTIKGKLTDLGHKGETIRSVRFMGDRGFVVTFKQSDPLYTIDISNPLEPTLVGELSILGFSSYLHIVDENRVLSIGRNADENGVAKELQFQLFDISDFANPTLADKIQIGDAHSYSEAQYNHKAFSYRASDLMFGVPYTNYSKDYSEHFGVYQIDDLSIKTVHTLDSNNSNWGNSARGLIFDMNNKTYGALFKGSNIMCEEIK